MNSSKRWIELAGLAVSSFAHVLSQYGLWSSSLSKTNIRIRGSEKTTLKYRYNLKLTGCKDNGLSSDYTQYLQASNYPFYNVITNNCYIETGSILEKVLINIKSHLTTPNNYPYLYVTVSCSDAGNTYRIVPGTHCSKFTQSAPGVPTETKQCPGGLGFDTEICVCTWSQSFDCPILWTASKLNTIIKVMH